MTPHDTLLDVDPNEPVDAEVELITRYLARELSPTDFAAVEARLERDVLFRERVRPIIAAWALPPRYSIDDGDLTDDTANWISPMIIDAGWRRLERNLAGRPNRDRAGSHPSWRIAAAALLIVGSLVGLAQTPYGRLLLTRAAGPMVPGPGVVLASGGDATSGAMPFTLVPHSERGGQGGLPPIHPLGAIEARSSVLFHGAPGVRPLSDGNVIVSDIGRQQLFLFDATLTQSRVVLDSGSSDPRTHYPGKPDRNVLGSRARLVPIAGDSTLLLDAHAKEFLVLGPDGRVARSLSAPMLPPGALRVIGAFPEQIASPIIAIDPRGRTVVRAFADPGNRPNVDSLPLFRTSAGIGVEPIATLRVPIRTGTDYQSIAVNPVPVSDDWAMLADGTVALMRSRDFHVDWIAPDGTSRSTAPVPFAWSPLSAARKQALIDSLGAYYRAHPLELGSSARPEWHTPAFVPDVVPITLLPDVAPAFSGHTAIGDADGRVWIRVYEHGDLPPSGGLGPWEAGHLMTDAGQSLNVGPSMQPPTGPPLYYVIDRNGAVVDRVTIPPPWEIAGFGPRGAVYLMWDRNQWLTSRHPSGPPEWELARAQVGR